MYNVPVTITSYKNELLSVYICILWELLELSKGELWDYKLYLNV